MKREKLEEGLREVLETLDLALKDKRGLLYHQRRLAFCLSLGATILLELYLGKLNIIKVGAKINHLWFRKKKEALFATLQNQVTSEINSVPSIKNIVDIIIKIENRRDDLAYGAPSTEVLLQQKINLFFELKEVVKC